MKQIILASLLVAVFLCLGCRSDTIAHAQTVSNKMDTARGEDESRSVAKRNEIKGAEKVMNIKDGLKFNDERPAILSVINSEKVNVKAVGLKKGQIMPKHKAGLKSMLVVLEGKIEFVIGDEKFVLSKLDAYEIPVNVEHEIRAIEQSIFSLTQEK
ncbi:MAG: cupin domain-containing protein [Pyrinomonadaceae bacterium]